jgi:PAS domain S-box-containing protein
MGDRRARTGVAMSGTFRPELLWFVVAGALPLGLAVRAFRLRESPASIAWGWVLIAELLWIFGQAAELWADGLTAKLWFDGFQWIPVVWLPVAMFVFVFRFTEQRRPGWLLPAYLATTVPGGLFLFTAPLHRLARLDAHVIVGVPFESLQYAFSLVDYGLVVVCIGGSLACTAIVVNHLTRVHPLHIVSVIPVVVGLVLPSLVGLIGPALDVRVFGQRDLSFLAFGGSALLVAWGVSRRQLFQLLPIARDTLFDRVPDAALVFDGEGRLVDMNRKAALLLGLTESRAIGARIQDLNIAGLDASGVLSGSVESPQRLSGTSPGREYELITHALDGPRDRLLVIRDVTDQANAERLLAEHGWHLERQLSEGARQLEATELKFRAIFDHTFQFIGLLNPDGTILEANQTSLNLVNAKEEDVIGMPFWETPWWAHSEALREQLRVAIRKAASGEFVRLEATHPAPDGSLRLIDFSLKPVTDGQGNVSLLIPEGRDITDLREAEQRLLQAQKMDALGRLAGGVAHDFNNLLTIIAGNVGLLADRSPDAEAGELLQQIEEACQTAASLTRQMLAFSRKGVLQPQKVDISGALERGVRLLGRVVPENISIEVESEAGLWPAYFDDAQLQQILLNLAVNARDAMPGGGRLTFLAENVRRPAPAGDGTERDWVKIDAVDTGHGMNDEQMSHVFEPFYTTKGPGNGTGLGLAMVYGALTQHGGFVTLESTPGTGSRFSLHLPRAPAGTVEQKQQGAPPFTTRGQGLIYIVEDEPGVRSLIARTLTQEGYEVRAFDGPEQLLAGQAELRRPALLITDLVMPHLSGLDLAERMNKMWPDLRVLITSGYSEDDRLKQTLERDTPFLPKPFTAPDLRRAAAHALSGPAWLARRSNAGA